MTKTNKILPIHKIEADRAASYIAGNHLFIISGRKCTIFEISQSLKPRQISEIELRIASSGYGSGLLGMLNGMAYFSIDYRIDVYDLRDVKKPHFLGASNRLLIGEPIFYANKFLITRTITTIIYDLQNPIKPTVAFDFSKSAAILVIGNHLLLADQISGLEIYDIDNPSNPQKVGFLNIRVNSLYRIDESTVLAEGEDYALYVIDVSNPENISLKSKIHLKGPLILCVNDYLFSRRGRATPDDTLFGFRLKKGRKAKNIFSCDASWLINYLASDKLLLLQGIKDYDGVSNLPNFNTLRYSVLNIQDDNIIPIGNIEMDGLFFSSIHILDDVIYIARPDGIYIYKV